MFRMRVNVSRTSCAPAEDGRHNLIGREFPFVKDRAKEPHVELGWVCGRRGSGKGGGHWAFFKLDWGVSTGQNFSKRPLNSTCITPSAEGLSIYIRYKKAIIICP